MKKHVALAVCLLAGTAGAIAQPSPTAPSNLDHFNCYFAPSAQQPQLAVLEDQFDVARRAGEIIEDVRLALFCNPVQKLHGDVKTPVQHPAAHMAMYFTTPQPSIPRSVTVSNQFGKQTLETHQAVILGVPSGKTYLYAPTVPAQLPPIPNKTDLDHFRCYLASGASVDTVVSLTDQFHSERARVLQPVLFCNPVVKAVPTPTTEPTSVTPNSVTTISNESGHLTCYARTPGQFEGQIIYNNQFVKPGTLPTLAVRNPEMLCVPSLKLEWHEIVPGATSGPGD